MLAKCLHDVWAHERGGPELQHQNLLVRVPWFYSSVVGEQNTVKTLTPNPHPSSSPAPSSPLPTARPPLCCSSPSRSSPPACLSLSCPLPARSRAVLTADGVWTAAQRCLGAGAAGRHGRRPRPWLWQARTAAAPDVRPAAATAHRPGGGLARLGDPGT